MTGGEMNRLIVAQLKLHNLVGIHHPDSRRIADPGRGWPDWVIVGKRIIYREVKGSNDILRPDQRRVARAIMFGGGDWAVWGPGDFFPRGRALDEFEEISLKGIRV